MDCDHIYDRSAFTHEPFILWLRHVLFLRTKHNLYLINLQKKNIQSKVRFKRISTNQWDVSRIQPEVWWTDKRHRTGSRPLCWNKTLTQWWELSDRWWQFFWVGRGQMDWAWKEEMTKKKKSVTIAHYINWWLKGRSRKFGLYIHVVGIARNRF